MPPPEATKSSASKPPSGGPPAPGARGTPCPTGASNVALTLTTGDGCTNPLPANCNDGAHNGGGADARNVGVTCCDVGGTGADGRLDSMGGGPSTTSPPAAMRNPAPLLPRRLEDVRPMPPLAAPPLWRPVDVDPSAPPAEAVGVADVAPPAPVAAADGPDADGSDCSKCSTSASDTPWDWAIWDTAADSCAAMDAAGDGWG